MNNKIAEKFIMIIIMLALTFCPFTKPNDYNETQIEKIVVVYEATEPSVIPTIDRPSRGAYTEEEIEPIVEPEIEEPVIIEPTIQNIDCNFNIMIPSNFTREDLLDSLDTASHQGISHLVDYFIEAEQTYGINALYLMSTIGCESGWGKYRSNVNNLAGWTDPYNGGFRYFNSEYECVMTVAAEVSTIWVDSVGSSLGSITKRYCPTDGYAELILTIMQGRQNSILY